MGESTISQETLRIVTKVALDTARGRTLDTCKKLFEIGDAGIPVSDLAVRLGRDTVKEENALQFLSRLGVVESFRNKAGAIPTQPRWKLTVKLKSLFNAITGVR
jgi:hypothetical protein